MASKTEKERRKAIAAAITEQKRIEAAASMPIPHDQLALLFDYLDNALSEGCDHSLKLTQQFLRENDLPEATTLSWLGEYGGHCDCEVLANLEEEWEHESTAPKDGLLFQAVRPIPTPATGPGN